MKRPLTSVSCERIYNGPTTDLKRTYKKPVEFYKILASKPVLRLHAATCVPTYSDVINIGLPHTKEIVRVSLKGWSTSLMSESKDMQKFLSMQMKMQKMSLSRKKDIKKGSVETHVSADPPKLLFDYERGKHCYKLFFFRGHSYE